MNKIKQFIKNEAVFSIAFLAALASCFFVKPDGEYLDYIDFRTLALLYCLMVVVAGLKKAGLFDFMAEKMCRSAGSVRGLSVGLVLLTFFCSMVITNDVALLTFVPFSVMVLALAGAGELLIPVVVIQTIAANLGSMLTPVGNPQNLFIFSSFDLSMGDFLKMTAPVWLLSLAVCLLLTAVFANRKGLQGPLSIIAKAGKKPAAKDLAVYGVLFAVCLLVVFRVFDWPVMLAAVALVLLALDRKILLEGDFVLLLTFVCFFVFSGNMARIPSISNALSGYMQGRTFLVSAAASQVISNVPAACLLAGFADDVKALLLGVDVGGLGTPIASLASLISFKLYCKAEGADAGAYMKLFLALNFGLLAAFALVCKLWMGV